MNNIKYLIIITKREFSETFTKFQKKNGITSIFGTLCNGTASRTTLDYLGIEDTEKVMLFSVAAQDMAKKILHGALNEMRIDIPGNGIALTIPMDCVGGSAALNYLVGNQILNMNEVNEMSEYKYSMIIAIAEKGSTDMVMEAAKSVGARGGTVVHAKGTGTEESSKFFGLSIAAEKELIYIVAKRQDRDSIIRAIMNQAGINTPAHAVVFSLPVDNVVGLRSVTDED